MVVSSLSGFVALPGQSAYSATKFALRGFADALRFEVRPASTGRSLLQSNIKWHSTCFGASDVRCSAYLRCGTETGLYASQLKGSGVALSIAYPGQTDTSMLSEMDARTKGLLDELPAINVHPARKVEPRLTSLVLFCRAADLFFGISSLLLLDISCCI